MQSKRLSTSENLDWKHWPIKQKQRKHCTKVCKKLMNKNAPEQTTTYRTKWKDHTDRISENIWLKTTKNYKPIGERIWEWLEHKGNLPNSWRQEEGGGGGKVVL